MNRQDGSLRQPERRAVLRLLGGGLVGLLIGTVVARPSSLSAVELTDYIVQPVPRRPRPATLSPALFVGKISQAYRIAREAPELLERMPCYCGCFRGNGHRSNLDCYVDRHAFG